MSGARIQRAFDLSQVPRSDGWHLNHHHTDEGHLVLITIVPADDEIAHEEASMRCRCKPDRDYEGAIPIIRHYALDGREAYESGVRRPH